MSEEKKKEQESKIIYFLRGEGEKVKEIILLSACQNQSQRLE